MKQSYWFTRSFSSAKHNQPTDNQHQTRKPSQKMPSFNSTFKKEIQQTTQNLIKMANIFEKFKTINKLYHNQLIAEDQNIKELRCLRHNSYIILFCSTDIKLLCSTCAYGSKQHSKHRVHEATGVQGRIGEELETQLKTFKLKSREVHRCRQLWEEMGRKCETIKQQRLDTLEVEREAAALLIASLYQKSKNKIQEAFDSSKQILKKMILSLDQMDKSLKIEHSVSSVRHLFIQQVAQQYAKLHNHLLEKGVGEQMTFWLDKFARGTVQWFKNTVKNLGNVDS